MKQQKPSFKILPNANTLLSGAAVLSLSIMTGSLTILAAGGMTAKEIPASMESSALPEVSPEPESTVFSPDLAASFESSDEIFNGISDGISDETSERTFDGTSEAISDEDSIETFNGISDGTSEGTSNTISDEASDTSSPENTEEISVASSQEISEEISDTPSEEISEELTEELPTAAESHPEQDPFQKYYASTVFNDYNVALDTAMGPMMYYCQHDSHWADYLYGGSDRISQYGCGPTTAAMIVNAFGNTGGEISPREMADWSAAYGYYAPKSGSYHDYIPAVLSAFDLKVESVQERTPEHVLSLLRSGHILVALMGKGTLTRSGHFIILRRANPDGSIGIADPNSYDNSCRDWDLQLILSELKKTYDGGGPLWAVSSY